MIVVRNSFTAKPGKAGKLATHLKEMAALGGLRNARVMTDFIGDFNTVVMEHEVESAAVWQRSADSRKGRSLSGFLGDRQARSVPHRLTPSRLRNPARMRPGGLPNVSSGTREGRRIPSRRTGARIARQALRRYPLRRY